MPKTIQIKDRLIGAAYPCFIIAEAGVNHNGDMEMAHRLIDAAAEAGVDAVKFQTFNASKLVTQSASKAEYQQKTTDAEESQFDMLRKLELSPAQHYELAAYSQKRNVLFLSTPFDEDSADFLDELGVAAFKMSSGEITNLPFLEHVARKGKPMIISTGMSFLGEVETAVRVVKSTGYENFALLHCVSNYPTRMVDVNLRAMHTLISAFQVPVGFSDHTEGIEIPLAAVALGACILEKHFTLDRTLPGPDHAASLEPDELVEMVRSVRNVEAALGDGIKQPAADEQNSREIGRRSIVAARRLEAGTQITRDMVVMKRPGIGLPASFLDYVVGRTLSTAVEADALIMLNMLS